MGLIEGCNTKCTLSRFADVYDCAQLGRYCKDSKLQGTQIQIIYSSGHNTLEQSKDCMYLSEIITRITACFGKSGSISRVLIV